MNLQNVFKILFGTTLVLGLLQGCNLKIVAPLSGAVVSDSGMYICQPGESCTITSNRLLLNEVFSVVPEQGYFFQYWLAGDNNLCSEDVEACATLINSGIDVDRDLISLVLSGEASFTLQPKFKLQNGFQAPIKAIRADVDVNYTTIEYPVAGSTYDEVIAQIQSEENPLPIKPETGRRRASEASSNISYDYFAVAFSEETCVVYTAEIQADYRSVLPLATDYRSMTEADQLRWNRAIDTWKSRVLARHIISRKGVSDVRSAIENSGIIDCDNLATQVRENVQEILLKLSADLAGFDLNASLGEI